MGHHGVEYNRRLTRTRKQLKMRTSDD